MDGMKAYKLSLVLDIACIIVAAAVLYCANAQLLPTWALIAGALVACALLIAAVQQLLKARRIFKQEAAQYAQQEKEDEVEPTTQEEE